MCATMEILFYQSYEMGLPWKYSDYELKDYCRIAAPFFRCRLCTG